MRNRRTKDQIQKDKYNSEVDAYNWYVVNLKTQKVESGFEYKSDAIDLLNDFDDKKQYKVVAKKTLKSMGIEIPNESWKYAKGGSLEAHGIKEGDTFLKTVSGTIQKVKDKSGKIVFIDLSNGYRDSQPPLPFEDGGYTDLSKSKPEVMNESKRAKYEVEIPEIDIEKIRTVDLNLDNNKILSLDDSIRVLKQLYDKGSINAYEEVKILFLDNSNKVIGVYNHSKGGITGTVIDVEMVCALAVKCLARGVIMSHNHPSGSLKFSDADIRVTRELKNALNLFKIALLDSIVITEYGFTSMTNEGILAYGGGISTKNGRDYSTGRNWTNDHRHHNKGEDYEVPMSKRKRFDNGGDLGMVISTKFKNYVSNHTSNESFLYNNRMLSSREITSQQYELNRNYVLARRSERGFAEGGDIGIEEEIDLTDDKRIRVKELTYEYKKPTAKELSEKHNSGAYEFMEQDKMMSGGKTTFQDKSNAIAKRFVGKNVEPKYQKEYGKVYSKDEAKEVGDKITGSMVAKEKMMTGGKTKKGNGGAMLLAKKIRKDGESWNDAVKRAWAQLK